jgi:dTDP-glucose 4,6-dehydratase
MPRYLVTGGAGFIGSNLVRFLLEDPANEVVNLDALTYAGNRDSLCDLEDNPRYQFLHLDLRDGPAVREAVVETKPDGIFHLAAESHVDRSIDTPGDFIETNIIGTYHLLQAAKAAWKVPSSKFRTPSARCGASCM